MEKISATVICMKEEENIQRCLESLDFADEIVVIDSGASERTIEICKRFADRIIHHPWPSYGQQMNYAMERVKNEWVLCLNANEAVSPELKKNMLQALKNDQGKYHGYRLNLHTFYLGGWINHGCYPELKIRLYKKSKARWVGRDPHYWVDLDGKCRDLKGDLEHYTYRDMSQHVHSIDSISSLKANEKFEEGKSVHLFDFVFSPLSHFLRLYILKRGFRDGVPGLIMAILQSYYCFLECAKLWEIKYASPPRSFNLEWTKPSGVKAVISQCTVDAFKKPV